MAMVVGSEFVFSTHTSTAAWVGAGLRKNFSIIGGRLTHGDGGRKTFFLFFFFFFGQDINAAVDARLTSEIFFSIVVIGCGLAYGGYVGGRVNFFIFADGEIDDHVDGVDLRKKNFSVAADGGWVDRWWGCGNVFPDQRLGVATVVGLATALPHTTLEKFATQPVPPVVVATSTPPLRSHSDWQQQHHHHPSISL
jgi:hypothetical protein